MAKRPFNILYHYIKRTSPKKIEIRNGYVIHTSSNPHDVITFVVVFCRRDYGAIKEGSKVIDVGANIGIFALYALMNGAGHIECFEPCTEAFEMLRLNIKRNGFEDKADLHKCAVSDNDFSSVLIPKSSSPYNAITEIKSDVKNTEMEEVRTINLVNALIGLDKIDLIKIDCEGAEFVIFPSFTKEFLEKVQEIRMELHGSKDKLLSCLKYNPFNVVEKNASNLWFIK